MNNIIPATPLLIGIDTTRSPVLLVSAAACDHNPGAVSPEECESFQSLSAFSRYWNETWRDSGVQVAVPADPIDPLGIRAWLSGIGQATELYEWDDYQTLFRAERFFPGPGYERPYMLALYACHRNQAHAVANTIWAKLREACWILEEVQHTVHRLAAALPQPVAPEPDWVECPF